MRRFTIGILLLLAMLAGCAEGELYQKDQKEQIPSAVELPGLEEESADPLGAFSTKFNQDAEGRGHNIILASRSINDIVVQPGEEFSYNKTIGPTTKNRGYELGVIFVSGKKDKGYGGGVCQVSSTLYNAADAAGFEIIERHDHSLPVGYVKAGREAATSYGVKDFRFKNDKDFPVLIKSYAENGEVTVKIYAL